MYHLDGEGLWWLHATHGFPLEFSIPMAAERGYVPTWDRFFLAAKRDGANLPVLARRVSDAVGDGYPAEFATGFRERLPCLLHSLMSEQEGGAPPS
jgi:hypothetical protein